MNNRQPPIRLTEFQDPEIIYQNLQGHGKQGVLTSRKTHQGVEVSGRIPSSSLPPELFVKYRDENSSVLSENIENLDQRLDPEHQQRKEQQEFDELADRNYFLNSQRLYKQVAAAIDQQQQQQQEEDSHYDEKDQNQDDHHQFSSSSPPKPLGWLHSIIENFFEFRNRQFQLKHANGLKYAISDQDDKASRMIVPSPITDDVAFHIFEMTSERYGIPTVVAQQCDLILRTAQFFSTRDVGSALFFTLLKTPTFDSNDVRFVVEARKSMRSSLVSQRGVDGVLRWFIPLRIVPHVIRKACEHPWARPVLAKMHSAFEKLLTDQRRKQMSASNSNDDTNSTRQNTRKSTSSNGPLFTLPAPDKLILIPPFGKDHPLVGRGPYVDVRGNEIFLGSQPPQLVIGADYLLCMLFCNWLDHRENAVTDVAEGKPIRSIINRRQGRIATHKTLNSSEATSVNKLAMFALEIDEDTGEFVQGLLGDSKYRKRFGGGGGENEEEGDDGQEKNEADGDQDSATGSNKKPTRHTTMSDLAALAEKYYQDKNASSSSSSRKNDRSANNNNNNNQNENSASSSNQNHQHQQNRRQQPRHEIIPPRVLHLYTK